MRARNIKPDFFRDYDLCTLDMEARILFAGLWCLADREGRLEDCPPRIHADVFPYDNIDIEKLLERLAEHGFIQRYTVPNCSRKYIQVVNFSKHQNPHKNEKPSEIPAVEVCRVITGQDQEITGVNRADSLIPDSLIPDSLIDDAGESQHQKTFRKMFEEKRGRLIELSKCDPDKFDIIAEQCTQHFKDKPVIDPYEKALSWFKNEFKVSQPHQLKPVKKDPRHGDESWWAGVK